MGPLLQSSSFLELAARILPALLDATMKGLLVLALAAAATAAMRRASAAARQLVWLLAIASLLVLPALSVALPAWQVLPSWARLEPMAAPETDESAAAEAKQPAGEVMDDAARAPVAEAAGGFEAAPAGDEAWAPHPPGEASPAMALPAEPTPDKPAMTEESPAASSPRDVLPWVMLVWALGALGCLAPPLLGRLSLWRLKRSSRPITGGSWQVRLRRARDALCLTRPVALLESDRRTMPMIWGIFRPTLLLPAEASDWPADRRRVVLLHELAHAKRRDCLSKLIGQLACAMYWFNPLCWLALRRLQAEAERACDDLVLNAGSRPADYAEHILEIASGLHAGTLAAHSSIAMARPRKLEGRLRAILDGTRNRRGLKRLIAVLALAAAACLVLPLAAMGPGKPKPESAPAGKAEAKPATQPAGKVSGQADKARIARLIAQLAAAKYKERDEAQKELAKIGLPAVAALQKAAAGKHPERASRAKVALKEIEDRAWEGPADGVQVRLRPLRSTWAAGKTPTLALDLRNRGDQAISFIPLAGERCRIEVDGVWRSWRGGLDWSGPATVLAPGKELLGAFKIQLTGPWAPLKEPDKHLKLTPGKHEIRVGFRRDVQKEYVASNPVEIEILAAEAARPRGPSTRPALEWGKPVEGVQIRLRPAKPSFAPDEDIVTHVIYRNVSDKPITVCTYPDPLYTWVHVHVMTGDSMRVLSGRHGTGIRRPLAEGDFVTLQPGQTASFRQVIAHPAKPEYQLKPGRYFLHVEINKINRMDKHLPGFDAFRTQHGIAQVWCSGIESTKTPVTIATPPATTRPGTPRTRPAGAATEKENIAWGKAVRGVQLGLAFGLKNRPVRVGELVGFKLWVRNTGAKEVRLVDFVAGDPYADRAALIGWSPTVRDPAGKTLLVAGSRRPIMHKRVRALSAGQGTPVGTVFLKIDARPQDRSSHPHLQLRPGKYRVSQTYRFSRGEGAWSGELSTGQLTLIVVRSQPATTRPGTPRIVTLVYDVRDLIVPIPDFVAPPLGATTQPPLVPPKDKRERFTRAQVLEGVVGLIKQRVAPGSWRRPGTTLRELGGQLIIRQTARNHEAIVKLLRELYRARSVHVRVESKFMTVSPGADAALRRLLKMPARKKPAEGPTAILPSQTKVDALIVQGKGFQSTRTLAAPRMALFNGQIAYVRVSSLKQETLPLVGQPGRQVKVPYQQGSQIQVQATVAADRRSVTMTLKPTVVELIRVGGRLEESTAALAATLTVPDGQTVLFRLPYARSQLTGARKVIDPKTGKPSFQIVKKLIPPAAGTQRYLYLMVKPQLVIKKEHEEIRHPAAQPAVARRPTLREILAGRGKPDLEKLAARVAPDSARALKTEDLYDLLKLREVGDEKAIPALAKIVAADAGRDRTFGHSALQALYCIGGKRAKDVLGKYLLKDFRYSARDAYRYAVHWDMSEPQRSGFIRDYVLKAIPGKLAVQLEAVPAADGQSVTFAVRLRNVSADVLHLREPQVYLGRHVYLRTDQGQYLKSRERSVYHIPVPRSLTLKPKETRYLTFAAKLAEATGRDGRKQTVLRTRDYQWFLSQPGPLKAVAMFEAPPLSDALRLALKEEPPWIGRAVSKPISFRIGLPAPAPSGAATQPTRRHVGELSPALQKERNRLLPKADAEIRAGLVELAKKFAQLRKARDWHAVSRRSPAGRISIWMGHTHLGKARTSPQVVPEKDRYGVLVVIRPPPPRPTAMAMFRLYPNLGLVGQCNPQAGDPQLDRALKKLVANALAPLKELDKKAASSPTTRPAGKAARLRVDVFRMQLPANDIEKLRKSLAKSHENPAQFFQSLKRFANPTVIGSIRPQVQLDRDSRHTIQTHFSIPDQRGGMRLMVAVRAQLAVRLKNVKFSPATSAVGRMTIETELTDVTTASRRAVALDAEKVSPFKCKYEGEVRLGRPFVMISDLRPDKSVYVVWARLRTDAARARPPATTRPSTPRTQPGTVTRVYDVRGLIVPIPDSVAPPLGAATRPAPATAKGKRERLTRAQLVENVLDLIRQRVDPESWRRPGTTLRELGGQLIIKQTARNHDAIVKLLRELYRARSVHVRVESRFMTVSPRTDAALRRLLKMPARKEPAKGPSGTYLSQTQADALIRASQRFQSIRTFAAPRMALFNGQSANVMVSSLKQVTLPLVGQPGRQIKVPYQSQIHVQATVAGDWRSVTLTLKPTVEELIRVGARLEESAAALTATVTVPDGQTVLFRLPYARSQLTGARKAADPKTGKPYFQIVKKPIAPAAGTQRYLYLMVKPQIIIKKKQEEIRHPAPTGASSKGASTKPATTRAAAAKGRELTLEGAQVTNESLERLKGRRLESLMLYQAAVTDEGLARLAKVHSLKKLYLRAMPGIKGPGLATLKEVQGLESLELWGTSVGEESLVHLAGMRSLRELSVGYMPLTEAGLAQLGKMTNLQRLNLYGCPVTDAGLAKLEPLRNLERLDLTHTQVTDAGLARLRAFAHLKELHVGSFLQRDGRGAISDAGAAHLAALANLEELYLVGRTAITDKGVKHLAGLKRLRSLSLVGTNASGHALKEIRDLPELKTLLLTGSQAETGIEHLKAMKKLSTLWLRFERPGELKLHLQRLKELKDALPPGCIIGGGS